MTRWEANTSTGKLIDNSEHTGLTFAKDVAYRYLDVRVNSYDFVTLLLANPNTSDAIGVTVVQFDLDKQ